MVRGRHHATDLDLSISVGFLFDDRAFAFEIGGSVRFWLAFQNLRHGSICEES